MPIDFKTFDSIINNTIDPDAENYSVMIRGRHGIGKSQVCKLSNDASVK